jgi:hypothetical protein
VLEVFRASQPSAFALLRDGRDGYRGALEAVVGREKPLPWSADIDALGLATGVGEAVGVLLRYLFFGASLGRPQGVHDERYWRRYVAGEPDHPTDQAVLRLLHASEAAAVASAFVNPETSRRAEALSHHVDGDRLVAAFDHAMEAWLVEPALDMGVNPCGLGEIFRAIRLGWNEQRLEPGQLVPILEKAIEASAAQNLGLAARLERLFLQRHKRERPILPDEEAARLALVLRVKLLRGAEGPSWLVRLLRGAHPETLAVLLGGFASPRWTRQDPPPFPDRDDFVECLAEAFAEAPDVVGPQLVRLLVGAEHQHDDPPGFIDAFSFLDWVAAQVFGGCDQLRRLFPYEGDEPWSREPRARKLVEHLRPPAVAPAQERSDP